jgi:hypothetical protein
MLRSFGLMVRRTERRLTLAGSKLPRDRAAFPRPYFPDVGKNGDDDLLLSALRPFHGEKASNARAAVA